MKDNMGSRETVPLNSNFGYANTAVWYMNV